VINHKRTERIYREGGLALRRKRHRKSAAGVRVIMSSPQRTNERWSMDFVTDSIVTGRRFRDLTIVDDYSRECPETKVLVLTQYDEEENMIVAKQSGAFGFIPKKAASSDLISGIRYVSQGKYYPTSFADLVIK